MDDDGALFRTFLDEYARAYTGKDEAYAVRVAEHEGSPAAELAMVLGSWSEEGIFPVTDEPWARTFVQHVDATLTEAAASLTAVNTVLRHASDGAAAAAIRHACRWVWSTAHEVPTFADFADRSCERVVPRKDRLPRFWAIPPHVLAWIEREHDREMGAEPARLGILTNLEVERLRRIRDRRRGDR